MAGKQSVKRHISPVHVKTYSPSSGGWAGWERRRVVTGGNLGNIAQYAEKVKENCSHSMSASEARLCLTRAVRGGG